MEGLRVREAGPADVAAVADLAVRTWVDAFAGDLEPAALAAAHADRSPAAFEDALATKTILVAELDGTLAGYVQFGDGVLDRLYVETALQGQGIGRRLLETALRHPRLAESPSVELQVWEENRRALQLYERYGFRRAGTITFTVGSQTMEDLRLILER